MKIQHVNGLPLKEGDHVRLITVTTSAHKFLEVHHDQDVYVIEHPVISFACLSNRQGVLVAGFTTEKEDPETDIFEKVELILVCGN